MDVSAHAEERMTERLGIKKSATDRMAQRAFERGSDHSQYSGSFRRYLDKLILSHNYSAKAIKIFGEHIYLFGNNMTLITVLQVPTEYKKHKPKK